MSLGSGVLAELGAIQAQAESLMIDTCSVQRPVGETTSDTGAIITTYTPVYTGKCRVRHPQGQVNVAESASSSVTTQQYELHVPVTAGPFNVGDVATVGTRLFRVIGRHLQTFQSAQRLPCTEVV